jgi:hypothetical protein
METAALAHGLNVFVGDRTNPRLPAVKRRDFCGISVEPDNSKASMMRGDREGLSHIAHTDDANEGVTAFDPLLQLYGVEYARF